MTVNIDVSHDLEARLVARARSIGQSLENYIHDVLEREAASGYLTGSEKAVAFRRRARGFPSELPLLSLENVSRDNIYPQD